MTDFDRLRKALDGLIYTKADAAGALLPSQGLFASPTNDKASTGPKYRPWDRSDLFQRLRSFKSFTWACKADCISPLECARRGWTNSKVDQLKCEFCQATMLFTLGLTGHSSLQGRSLTQTEVLEESKKFAEKLSSGHESTCPWNNTACDQDLVVFPAVLPDTVQAEYDQRLSALQQLSALPPLTEAATKAMCEQRRTRLAALFQRGAAEAQPVQNGQDGLEPHQASAESAITLDLLCSGLAGAHTLSITQRMQVLALCGWSLEREPTLTGLARSASRAGRVIELTSTNIAGGSMDLFGQGAAAGASSMPAAPFGRASAGPAVFGLQAMASQASQPFSRPTSAPLQAPAPASNKRKRDDPRAASAEADGVQEPAAKKSSSEAAPVVPEGRKDVRKDLLEKYGVKELNALDPLTLHRLFCPWRREGPEPERRCGWRWCLDNLIPCPGAEEPPPSSFDSREGADHPAQRLRALLGRTLREA
ncbi:hypothetical protein WJX73_008714 [Symbiochloris irregularis]|uniref:C3HC-type domain-containing protein n=1 Tax=Symbiochloris irregularis TaxID=706552 RepID=A0AAW1PEB3_9CHLO